MSGAQQEFSVLFADVSGSTKLHERLGEREALHAVERCIKRMERSVEGFKGRLVKVVGDEMLAVFEEVEDAFHAAQDMQQRIADLPPVSGVKLGIRIGFGHGPVNTDKDQVSGETVKLAARLAGLAKAGQILTDAATIALLPELQQLSTRTLAPASSPAKGKGLSLSEVLWEGATLLPPPVAASKPATAKPAPKPAAAASRLRITHRGKAFVIDERVPHCTLGRDATSDVVIRDQRASRQHARIERRGSDFVLADLSTNGTYVSFEGRPEIRLNRSELVLRGRGRISFATSGTAEGADIAEFEFF